MTTPAKDRVTVGITGASGAPIAVRLIRRLIEIRRPADLLVTDWGAKVFAEELTADGDPTGASFADVLFDQLGGPPDGDLLAIHDNNDMFSRLASGTGANRRMVVAPCTVSTMAHIASGLSTCLLERAADVVLKERGRLVLAVRESPLSAIHLRHMARLAEAGAVIAPPVMTFYHRPRTIEDQIALTVDRLVGALGLDAPGAFRWDHPHGTD